jgi:signal transduction histidine kinase
MRQMLRNLLSNGLKFQSANATADIRIGSRPLAEGRWEISVQDNGIGFDQRAQARIFLPFQRLHNANYPGSGMGLAICHRIVNTYGGSIRATSEPGRGSTFYFTAPAVRAEDDADHAACH